MNGAKLNTVFMHYYYYFIWFYIFDFSLPLNCKTTKRSVCLRSAVISRPSLACGLLNVDFRKVWKPNCSCSVCAVMGFMVANERCLIMRWKGGNYRNTKSGRDGGIQPRMRPELKSCRDTRRESCCDMFCLVFNSIVNPFYTLSGFCFVFLFAELIFHFFSVSLCSLSHSCPPLNM